MTKPEAKCCTELSERDRRFLMQQMENAYYGRDLEALRRLFERLLAAVPVKPNSATSPDASRPL